MNVCPACGSANVRRSAVRKAEHGAHAFRSPYRCEECGTRYWVISHKTRMGFAAAGISVAGLAFLVVGAMVLASLVPKPADVPTPFAFPHEDAPILRPLSSIPNQAPNETRRLERTATAPLPSEDDE